MEEINKSEIGIIILAAGESKRLGRPKQLLVFKNQTLISKTVETALETNCKNISVVLGSNAEKIQNEIENFPVNIYKNENWKDGMGSSIKCGLNILFSETDEIIAVIFMLCDQPLIEYGHINLLIEKFAQTNKPIIASEYKNTIGVPALFSKEMFDELLNIEGDKGARKIIKKFENLVEKVPIPEAEFDVDTFEDFQKLNHYE